MRVLAIRIEDPRTHLGLLTATDVLGNDKIWKSGYHVDIIKRIGTEKFPSWEQDPDLSDKAPKDALERMLYYEGFATVEQLKDFLTHEEARSLIIECGFRAYIYYVYSDLVSPNLVVFKRVDIIRHKDISYDMVHSRENILSTEFYLERMQRDYGH